MRPSSRIRDTQLAVLTGELNLFDLNFGHTTLVFMESLWAFSHLEVFGRKG